MKTFTIQRPDFALTAEELAQATTLQAQYEHLAACASSLSAGELVAKRNKALADFTADPTRETLEAIKLAEFEKQFFQLHTRPRSVARNSVESFLRSDVPKWAAPIVEKALGAARAYLTQVTASERARHLKLTGLELGTSEVIAIADRPVAILSTLWRDVEPIDIEARQKKLVALRDSVAKKGRSHDELRGAYITGEKLSSSAADYDRASMLLRKAEDSFREASTQLSSRKLLTPAKILDALNAASNPFQAAALTPEAPVPIGELEATAVA
jgi:hypothetical protein